MNKIAVMLVVLLAAVQAFACAAITKKGTQCKRAPSPGSQYCWQHGGTTSAQRAMGLTESDIARIRCKAITKAGTQCKRTAKPGSEYCWQHGAARYAKAGETVAEASSAPAAVKASSAGKASAVTAERVQCDAITKSGKRCSRKALQDGTKCWQHVR